MRAARARAARAPHAAPLTLRGARAPRRYCVQLLTPARVLATTQGREKILLEDVEEVDSLFCDAKASAKHLAEHEDKYLL